MVGTIASFGLTDRQRRFLATVMVHSGVFVGRQYAAFAEGRRFGPSHLYEPFEPVQVVEAGFVLRRSLIEHGSCSTTPHSTAVLSTTFEIATIDYLLKPPADGALERERKTLLRDRASRNCGRSRTASM